MPVSFKNCPACGSYELLNTGKPIDCEPDSVYSDMKCLKCSLHWCDPMPTKNDLDEYYNKYYTIRYNTVDKSRFKTRLRSILTFRKSRLKSFFKLIQMYSPVKSILDFGCGEADILYLASDHKWKVLGVDYSNELKNKFESDNINFIHGSSLHSTGIAEKSLGCIVVKHVVEHIPELENFLFSVKDYLVPGGILAVKTPSASSIRARLNTSNWHRVRPMEHFWGFDKNNFSLLMKKCGFEIHYIEDNIFVNELTCIAKISKDIDRI